MNTFVKKCRIRMEELQLTQVELADRMGVKQSNISAYLLGKASPGLEVIYKYAEALEVSPGWLISEDDGMVRTRKPSKEDIIETLATSLLPEGKKLTALSLVLHADDAILETLLHSFQSFLDQGSDDTKRHSSTR